LRASPLRTTAIALALAMIPAAAADARVQVAKRPEATAAKPFFDVRTAARARAGARTARPGRVLLDPITGTVRAYNARTGALSSPSARGAVATARAFARDRATRLGLTAADVDALAHTGTVTGSGGLRVVHFGQRAGGIPFFDNGLRVGLDRAGRVVAVSGSPVHAPGAGSTVPRLGAAEAMAVLQRDVGSRRPVSVQAPPAGARRLTRFSTGDTARLVLFRAPSGTRLAWRLTLRAASTAAYHAVIDATTGALLYRANLVKFSTVQNVFRSHPGEADGSESFDLDPYIDDVQQGQDLVSGPYSYAYTDVDDDNSPAPQEQVSLAQTHDFVPYTTPPELGCSTSFQCAWNQTVRTSWEVNREHSAIQAQFYAGTFHDHLASAPIGFTDADGNFECNEDPCQVNLDVLDPALSDPVEINALDGAATDGAGGPNPAHTNNANMATFPDGVAPLMQMYLFDTSLGAPVRFRDIDGDDDAGTLYHEYAHGLSNRLVVDGDGFGALSSPHAGAMGEAWSDWYAMDFLVGDPRTAALHPDTAAPGEVDVGYYSDLDRHATRFNPQDCPVIGPSTPNAAQIEAECPGGVTTGPGGFTLGDFGKVADGPEVHSDGEIWMETLWDLRTALVAATGSATQGSAEAETLVTNGMRLSPPEPSFLDMRNAILAADAANGGTRQALVWDVFRNRGMGFYAGAADGSDVAPVEDFNQPPAAGAPTGSVTGRVTDADTGLPVAGVPVGLASHPDLSSVTASDGRYSIGAVPAGAYPKLVFRAVRGYDQVIVPTVTVTAGRPAVHDVAVRFDWAALAGGGGVVSDTDLDPYPGCTSEKVLDQSLGTGWSAWNPASPSAPPGSTAPSAVLRLADAVDVTQFGVDPANTCGDDPSATTRDFKIETSPDGTTWTVALSGAFAPEQAHRLNLLQPAAGAQNVRYVRLTMLSPQNACPPCSGHDFIDFSELEVYGGKANVLPSGTLTASPAAVRTGETVKLTAAFTDPDSAITGYDWDLDGNGTVDRSTGDPATETSYASPGARTVRVAARDFRGGAGSASAAVTVTQAVPPLGAKPLVAVAAGGKRSVKVTITCDSACSAKGTLKITKRLRRKLGLKSRIVARLSARLKAPGTRAFRLRLTPRAVRAMKRRKAAVIKATAAVTAVDAEKQRRTLRRSVRLRR
jgi:hypothetical protein